MFVTQLHLHQHMCLVKGSVADRDSEEEGSSEGTESGAEYELPSDIGVVSASTRSSRGVSTAAVEQLNDTEESFTDSIPAPAITQSAVQMGSTEGPAVRRALPDSSIARGALLFAGGGAHNQDFEHKDILATWGPAFQRKERACDISELPDLKQVHRIFWCANGIIGCDFQSMYSFFVALRTGTGFLEHGACFKCGKQSVPEHGSLRPPCELLRIQF